MNDPTEGEQMSNMNGDMEGVIESLRRLKWAAENRVSEAQALLDQVKAERDHIVRMLKVAGVQEEQPKAKAKKEKPARVNEETRASVLNAIRLWAELGNPAIPGVPGSFTTMDLEEYTPLHSSSIRNAVKNLRDEGIVRAVGLKAGMPRRAPMVYALGEGNEASE
jgi:hypothetical protein